MEYIVVVTIVPVFGECTLTENERETLREKIVDTFADKDGPHPADKQYGVVVAFS